jgi:protein-S-isoprenylcysteine O-methyltransferase Ste14
MPVKQQSKATEYVPWLTAIASLAVGSAFFALWFCLLPTWLSFRTEATGTQPWRWLAAIPSVLGFAMALRCVWDFGWTGHGTPAPIAPPKKLVVVGFYRYVRNPMYVGFAVGGLWPGEHGGNRRSVRGCSGSAGLRPALRRADTAEEVWR